MLYTKYEFKVHGYSDFIETVLPELDEIFTKTINDKEECFQIAIMEAVNNAARYSLKGLEEADISIEVIVHSIDIKVVIRSKTREFDVKGFCKKIRKLGLDDKWSFKNFGEYKGESLYGRGIWLMLQACEYMYMDVNDRSVTLCTSYPVKTHQHVQNIGVLAQRFYITEGGVVYA